MILIRILTHYTKANRGRQNTCIALLIPIRGWRTRKTRTGVYLCGFMSENCGFVLYPHWECFILGRILTS